MNEFFFGVCLFALCMCVNIFLVSHLHPIYIHIIFCAYAHFILLVAGYHSAWWCVFFCLNTRFKLDVASAIQNSVWNFFPAVLIWCVYMWDREKDHLPATIIVYENWEHLANFSIILQTLNARFKHMFAHIFFFFHQHKHSHIFCFVWANTTNAVFSMQLYFIQWPMEFYSISYVCSCTMNIQ